MTIDDNVFKMIKLTNVRKAGRPSKSVGALSKQPFILIPKNRC